MFLNISASYLSSNNMSRKVSFQISDPEANIFLHPQIYGLYCKISLFFILFNDIKGVFVLFGLHQLFHLEGISAKRPCITVVYP